MTAGLGHRLPCPAGSAGPGLPRPASLVAQRRQQPLKQLDLRAIEPPGDPFSTGALLGAKAPKKNAVRPAGEWNSLSLRVEGERIRATINGADVLDATAGDSSIGPRGFVCLDGAVAGISYRRILLYELPAGAAGGPGAVTQAMADAAREAGAKIRTGAGVREILVKDGADIGVALADGTEIRAATIVSGADPRRTFLGLIDPVELEPGFITRIRNYRCPGTVAKVNVALNALPSFRGLAGDPADSAL